ncbi:Src-like protein 3 domain [Rhizoctonia solani]|uniref:Src-like protein 3 domain n=1 Tax=Rhizoctonia solani TaxID=456999 RepID=A0A8H7IJK9_9AGAM|nr:Src-like protein 3 domain [Rhizoctonia solani]
MANYKEVTVDQLPSEPGAEYLQPQPTSPFPSPSSSFVPPPAQEPHEFANKIHQTTTRIAAAKQPRSAVHSRRNSSEDRQLLSSPSHDSNSQPLAPDQALPTPSLKRFSVESNNSLSSSRPAPASPALSRHSSFLHAGSAKRLSTLSIVSTSTPPLITGVANRRMSIKIRDFAFLPADERHFGRSSRNRDSVASSTGSEVFYGSLGPGSPSSSSSGCQSPGEEEEPIFVPGIYRALYPFEPEGTAEMALVEDQRIHVLGRGGGVGWVVVLKPDGEHALVPEGYLELVKADLEEDDDDESVGTTEPPQTPRACPSRC